MVWKVLVTNRPYPGDIQPVGSDVKIFPTAFNVEIVLVDRIVTLMVR